MNFAKKMRFILRNQKDIDELSRTLKLFPKINNLCLFLGGDMTVDLLHEFGINNPHIKSYTLYLSP